jgi:uncharacterized protein YndB with AHSA1/START domain
MALERDIAKFGEQSRFVKVAEDEFALMAWTTRPKDPCQGVQGRYPESKGHPRNRQRTRRKKESEKPTSVFVTYIIATPENLWEALTNGDFTKQYFFGRRMESAWKIGGPWRLVMEDGRIDCQGKVLESDRFRRLVLTWHVEWMEELSHLPEAVVTFQIDAFGEVARLTISEFHPAGINEKYLEGGRKGWPIILSGLKSLLETGHPMPKFQLPDMATE